MLLFVSNPRYEHSKGNDETCFVAEAEVFAFHVGPYQNEHENSR